MLEDANPALIHVTPRWPIRSTVAQLSRVLFHRLLKPAIGMARESPLASRMYGCVVGPRPAAKLRSPVIRERLLQFRTRVHHEGPILRDRFANRLPLQQEDFDRSLSRIDGYWPIGADLNRRWTRYIATGHIAIRDAQPGPGKLM